MQMCAYLSTFFSVKVVFLGYEGGKEHLEIHHAGGAKKTTGEINDLHCEGKKKHIALVFFSMRYGTLAFDVIPKNIHMYTRKYAPHSPIIFLVQCLIHI